MDADLSSGTCRFLSLRSLSNLRKKVKWCICYCRDPLITNVMWRNLFAQALYQVTLLLTLNFAGKDLFNIKDPTTSAPPTPSTSLESESDRHRNTIIFNTFVFCQVNVCLKILQAITSRRLVLPLACINSNSACASRFLMSSMLESRTR